MRPVLATLLVAACGRGVPDPLMETIPRDQVDFGGDDTGGGDRNTEPANTTGSTYTGDLGDAPDHLAGCLALTGGDDRVSADDLALAGSGAMPSDPVGSGSLVLGSTLAAGDNEPWTGQLADVRIWSELRSEEEISADMAATLTGEEPGLELL